MLKNPFKKPSAAELARMELEESKRELLQAERAVETWTAQRAALLQRIERLEKVQ